MDNAPVKKCSVCNYIARAMGGYKDPVKGDTDVYLEAADGSIVCSRMCQKILNKKAESQAATAGYLCIMCAGVGTIAGPSVGHWFCSDKCKQEFKEIKMKDKDQVAVNAELTPSGFVETFIPGRTLDLKVTKEPAEISDTLKERGSRYGKFSDQAKITQNLKRAMRDSPNWDLLKDDMKEALEMVQHKVARILNGDPNFVDSWFDIEGYTKLVRVRVETGEKI